MNEKAIIRLVRSATLKINYAGHTILIDPVFADEKNYCLRGRRKKRTYSLGDAITIKVARANLEKKQLDFALVE